LEDSLTTATTDGGDIVKSIHIGTVLVGHQGMVPDGGEFAEECVLRLIPAANR
jgi:hypothetical protein